MPLDEPTDIILLSHNRLAHLRRTIEALRARTPEPFRLTVVDNASSADTRRWLSEHREWFHQLIPRPTNENLPAFQYGIEATTSDPYIVSDPDLVLPAMEPSWLSRLRTLMDRHPKFGMISVDLDPCNFPDFLTPERAALLREPGAVLDGGALIEANVGPHFTLIRRDALRIPYTSDQENCRSVRSAGYQTGYSPEVKAIHLGFDDVKLFPSYLQHKHAAAKPYQPSYWESVEAVGEGLSLEALAVAGPVIDATRRSGIADISILELAWRTPCIGHAVDGVKTLWEPPRPLPVEDDAVSAVLLLDPPQEAVDDYLEEAWRISRGLVVLVTTLEAVDGRFAHELADSAWIGEERHAASGDVVALVRHADRVEELRTELRLSAVEHRDSWLELFSKSSFGSSMQRLFVFRRAVIADDAGTAKVDEDLLARHALPPIPLRVTPDRLETAVGASGTAGSRLRDVVREARAVAAQIRSGPGSSRDRSK